MEENKLKTALAAGATGIFVIITFGLIWFFFLGPETPVGFGWYLFSFAAGLSMIVLPCTLPLAFVIVPLSMGKGAVKGFTIALAFGLGIAITLSMYGIIAAVIGEVAIGTLGAPLETVKNWLYFAAGFFAYIFALGEIGLVNFHMPTYTGAAPLFIQKQQDYIKALLLGLFLGNIGIGCPHPATPVLLTRIAASGDVFYGWLLFFTHAVGRVLPLLLLAILGILGVNALSWLVARKDRIERATGWAMIFVAAFILVLGLFSHDWWVASGQHTLLEEITGEEKFLGIIIERFNFAGAPHGHDFPNGAGLLGLPLGLGNWVLVLLWVLPIWWVVMRKEKEFMRLNQANKAALPSPALDGETGTQISIRRACESNVMSYRITNAITITLLLAAVFIWALPARFYHKTLGHTGQAMPMPESAMHKEDVMGPHEAKPRVGADQDHLYEESEISKGIAVQLQVAPPASVVGVPMELKFFVHNRSDYQPITASSLQFNHEKLMHAIGVREDLNEFFHIHPLASPTPGFFTATRTFPKPGTYKIWSEVTQNGINHVFGHPLLAVSGEGPSAQKIVSFAKSVMVNNYQIVLNYDSPIAKKSGTKITFEIHDSFGNEVTLEPYLGAAMHLAIIKDDLKQLIHAHPNDHMTDATMKLIPTARAHGGKTANTSSESHGTQFHIVFPEEGTYKLFAQFRPQDIGLPADTALTASFWVKVETAKPFGFSNWWVNLFVSVILIIILSKGIKKYLTVAISK